MNSMFLVALAVFGQHPTGQIAFLHRLNDSEQQVCLLDLSSGHIEHITPGAAGGPPVWSPDGSKLAFEEARDMNPSGMRVVSADGATIAGFSHGLGKTRSPAWSPDGSKVAYAVGDRETWSIGVYDLASGRDSEWGKGGDQDENRPRIAFLNPVWRSNAEIVAVGIRDDREGRTADLYEIEKDGVTMLVETRGGGLYVEWNAAPHVRTGQLAYESNDGGDREIFVYSPQRGAIDVSNHRAPDWNPVWSPDGDWLAFESFRGGSRGIYKVTPRRTQVTPVAADAAGDNFSPTWSPDGEWIAFVSTRSGKPSLYACRVDGSDPRALTHHEGEDLAPAWRPAKSK